MGLAITVGALASLLQDDPESAEELKPDFAAINVALQQHGLPSHVEPESLPPLDDRTPVVSFPYSSMHYLRRWYALLIAGLPPTPVAEDENPAEDEVIDQVTSPDHHLLWHSDAEGYYVPINFPEAIEDEDLPGIALGSTNRLFAELCLVAPALGIQLQGTTLGDDEAERITAIIDDEGDLNIELMVWLALFEAARLSLAHKTAIRFE